MSSCCLTLKNCGNMTNPAIAATPASVNRSASLDRTGCRSASKSHQADTNSATTIPPVMCSEKTPTSASTATGMRSRCRNVEVISTIVGTAMP